MIVILGVLIPLLLTSLRKRIIIKKKLTLVIIIVSPIMTFMKMWIYCQFTDTKNVNSSELLQSFLGYWPN